MVFKIEGNMPEIWTEQNRIASWSDIPLFNNLILVAILFGLSLLSRLKEQIILETSVLSVGLVKNDSMCKGGR